MDERRELGGNGEGRLDLSERDMGEDWDGDGFYDVFEDLNYNHTSDLGEDLDHDGRVAKFPTPCDGYDHEDLNCNGSVDYEEDANLNGHLDPDEDLGIWCLREWGYCPEGFVPGTKKNGKFDTEDANGNGVLDVVGNSGYTTTPFWNDANGNNWPDPGEYRAPLQRDQDLFRDSHGRTYGPYPYEFEDHRQRFSWIEDLSIYVGDAMGTHDLKLGSAYEREAYDSDTLRRPSFSPPGFSGIVGVPAFVNNTVTGDNLGLYLQDTWKPLPNLTVGLGLRYDFEYLQSFGYSHFDPVTERRNYNTAMSAAGVDLNPTDNVSVEGLCRDPIHSCLGSLDLRLQTLMSQMRSVAFSRLTRHNLEVEVLSGLLGATTGGSNTLSGLLGYPVSTRRPEDFDISNSNLAPRLSLSWDPWADGKTMVFGSWGKYYDKLFMNTVTLEQGPDMVNRTYQFDSNGVDDLGVPNNQIGRPISQSSLSAFMVDRSLSTPYSVEWTAGFRRELAPEVLVSLRYINRDYHDQLQDIDINHHTEIDPLTGKLADRLGDLAPGPVGSFMSLPNGAPDLYIENFFFNRVFMLGNFNEQTYRGWEIELVRRLKRKWQMEASYAYSIAQGDAETFLSELGNDPSLAEYEPGYLDFDQRHVVKFNAVAFLPGDWRLGGTITWASGLPYSGIVHRNDSDDVGYTQNRIVFGQLGITGFGITPENRNIHRNHAAYVLNGRVMKSFVIGKASASAFLEVYNLLNTDDLRLERIDQIPARLIENRNGDILIPPVYNLIGERDFGRRYQIGFQVDF